MPSRHPMAMRRPSAAMAAAPIGAPGRIGGPMRPSGLRVAGHHQAGVRRHEQHRCRGREAQEMISPSCESLSPRGSPVAASQRRTDPSAAPVATMRPSGAIRHPHDRRGLVLEHRERGRDDVAGRCRSRCGWRRPGRGGVRARRPAHGPARAGPCRIPADRPAPARGRRGGRTPAPARPVVVPSARAHCRSARSLCRVSATRASRSRPRAFCTANVAASEISVTASSAAPPARMRSRFRRSQRERGGGRAARGCPGSARPPAIAGGRRPAPGASHSGRRAGPPSPCGRSPPGRRHPPDRRLGAGGMSPTATRRMTSAARHRHPHRPAAAAPSGGSRASPPGCRRRWPARAGPSVGWYRWLAHECLHVQWANRRTRVRTGRGSCTAKGK